MRHYTATLKFEEYRSIRNITQVFREDCFVAERVIAAANRRVAVRKALQWFSTRFNGSVGPAWKVLTLDDPGNEVTYDEDFSCSDLRNKLLPEDVIQRLLAASNGELVRDTRSAWLGHPLCAVRRTKRRVKFKAKAIAPCVYQNACGTIFYRITQRPQISRSGVVLSKRNTRLVRLAARTLPAAIKEIRDRGLPALHQSRRIIKKRSLAVLQQLPLSSPQVRGNDGATVIPLFAPKGDTAGSQRDRRSLETQDRRATDADHFPRQPRIVALRTQ